MASRKRSSMGQRREVQFLLPSALLMMVVLSTFALFAYRSTIILLLDARHVAATRMGRQLSQEFSRGMLPDREALRQRLPTASAVTLRDGDNQILIAVGDPAPPGEQERTWWPLAPRGLGEDLVTARVPFERKGSAHSVQVDLPAPVLRSRERALRILTPVVLVVNGAITVWVLFFLRRFLEPFDKLVERARSAGQEMEGSQDEVAFLVDTFERALEALAHREIDEMETLQGTLGRSLKSGVLLCDGEGKALALNEMGSEMLGVEGVEVGATLAQALQGQDGLVDLLERSILRGEPVQREECTVTTSVGKRTLGITVHPLRREDGTIRGFLIIFADLTEAKEELREKHLVESLAQLGELTAGVAHELRNSLATQRGYLTLMEREDHGQSMAEYLQEMRHESDHLARVLEDFLTFARPGSVRAEEVDLAALAHRAASDPALAGAPVVVRLEADAEELTVSGDSQLLERALRNVLSNAVEVQREAGTEETVEIALSNTGPDVQVLVLDRGPGISPEVREKLFDPFFTGRSGGVGLGLALTRRIVLLHSGKIELESREGGGAQVRVSLPAGKNVSNRNKSFEPR